MAFRRHTMAAGVAVVVAVAGVLAFLLLRGPDVPQVGGDESGKMPGEIEEGKSAGAAQPTRQQTEKLEDVGKLLQRRQSKGSGLPAEPSLDEKYEALSQSEKKLYDSMQEISDENTISYRRVRKATEEALASENPTLRLKALETMMPFADEAVLDIVPLLVDDDEEVRESASNLLEQGMQMMDDEEERIAVVSKLVDAEVMSVDTFRMCSSYIEMMDDKIAALNVILPIMEKTKDEEMLAELKDTYDNITGEGYVDLDHAYEWVNNYLNEQENEQEKEQEEDLEQ